LTAQKIATVVFFTGSRSLDDKPVKGQSAWTFLPSKYHSVPVFTLHVWLQFLLVAQQ